MEKKKTPVPVLIKYDSQTCRHCSYKNILSYFSANCCSPGLNLPFRMNLTAEGPQLSLTAWKATGLKNVKGSLKP